MTDAETGTAAEIESDELSPADVELVETARAIVQRVHYWLDGLGRLFREGNVVHVTFAPGDMTAYAMTFVPPQAVSVRLAGPGREYARLDENDALLCLLSKSGGGGENGVCVPIALDGWPVTDYVADKIGTTHITTAVAVGVVWMLMLGRSVDDVVAAHGWTYKTGGGRSGAECIRDWEAFKG